MSLKVGLLNDSFPPTIDGVANTVINYARVLHDMGCGVTVITPKYPRAEDNYDFDVYRYFSIGLNKRIGYRAGIPTPVSAGRILSKKLDILHVHAPFVSSIMAKSVSIRPHRSPTVFTYHTKFDIDIDARVKNKPIRKIARRIVLANINMADEVWVVTETAAKSLRDLGYKSDYMVMENGTDFPRGKTDDKFLAEVCEKYGIPSDRLIFLFVGRMQWYKNIKLIIDTLKEVKGAGVAFQMYFVGDGNDRSDIERYIKEVGMDDCISCLGAIYDRSLVRAFCSRADLFLFPSVYDTSGLVVKEAAAAACPSLLIKGAAAAEGVEDGFSGLLAEESPESCAKSVIDAVHSGRLAEMGLNAMEHVYLSWEDAVGKAYDRYEKILESWPKRKK